jgi:hypothetical protein
MRHGAARPEVEPEPRNVVTISEDRRPEMNRVFRLWKASNIHSMEGRTHIGFQQF